MKNFFFCSLSPVIFLIVVSRALSGVALPLYTNSRWIVDEQGKRVKLACVNWPSHIETILAEGLNKRPVDFICKSILANGFNCVRLTWPVVLPTNDSLASTTVEKHFQSVGLLESIAGIRDNNPDFLNFTLLQAYQTVVSKLNDNNIMVILDNHVSKPTWCCSEGDGNGFFGDQYFDPELWLKGLGKMATLFNRNKNVVGMSLRNELRGPKQDATVWHRYMEQGAEVVHQANPNAIVILSGLSFDNDLGFLKSQPVNVSFTKKLVFEVHRYGISIGEGWKNGNPNDVCGNFISTFANNAQFLINQGFPLFLSEFGGDQRGGNVNDNRFLDCIFGVIADLDLDWALWTLQGSYYFREGNKDPEEVYGVLNKDWTAVRNLTYMTRIKSIQDPNQGPGLFDNIVPYNLLYHPSTGHCIQNNLSSDELRLALCEESTPLIYNASQKTIMTRGTNSCLQAVGMNMPIKLGICNISTSNWEMISSSKMHLSTNITNGGRVCLDIDGYKNGTIITSSCRCLQGDVTCESGTQWFKIIASSRIQVIGTF